MTKRDALLALIKGRKDADALAIMKADESLCDNTVVRYALDNRCFACIRFLRQNGYITLAGREERDHARMQDLEDAMVRYEELLQGLNDNLKS